MKRFVSCGLGAVAAIAVAGCSDAGTKEPTGPGVKINVAPYTLVGATTACYNIIIKELDDGTSSTGSPGATVVDLQNICGESIGGGPAYGFGPAISYVAPCSAAVDNNPTSTSRWNSVTLEVVDLYDSSGNPLDGDEWVNPCPKTAGRCVKTFLCEENADVPVEFNLTVMMDANQGFFDIAVNFDDVFCSAKWDTCYEPENANDTDNWIRLLFKDFGQESERWYTGIFGFACTGGVGADTNLYMDKLVVLCGEDDPIEIVPLGDGNQDAPPDQNVVFGYAVYSGKENIRCGANNLAIGSLSKISCGTTACTGGATCIQAQGVSTCGVCNVDAPCPDGYACVEGSQGNVCEYVGGDCAKKYWNVAVGFNVDDGEGLSLEDCTLYAQATASDGEFFDEWATWANQKYPIVRVVAPLTDGFGNYLCGNWGLDETNDGEPLGVVASEYTSFECGLVDGAEFWDLGEGDEDCDFCFHRNGVEPEGPVYGRAECAY